ncbi:radical SAM protein [Desulfomarina sp.]
MVIKIRQAAESGELAAKIARGKEVLRSCTLCPRNCYVDRPAGEKGYCGMADRVEVAGYGPHFGEEQVLVGEKGSGTIFFCGCNLRCVFCQNYSISNCSKGECEEVSPEQLAAIMLELQGRGCHNINLVTPGHIVPQLLQALQLAVEGGLRVPLVYNCGGYESMTSLKLLDGVIDIYMPDFKFLSPESARRYTGAADYPEIVKRAVIEMQRQVGDLQLDDRGLATHGLLVRHLLMPDAKEDSESIFAFLAERVSLNCHVNIMEQYRPCGMARDFPELGRTISAEYYNEMIAAAKKCGLAGIESNDFSKLLARLFSS